MANTGTSARPYSFNDNGISQESDFISLVDADIDRVTFELMPPQIARLNKVVPLGIVEGRLNVAMSYPYDQMIIDNLSLATGLKVRAISAQECEINSTIRGLRAELLQPEIHKAVHELIQTEQWLPASELSAANGHDEVDAPAIRLVNHILMLAVLMECSDIHVDVLEQQARLRFRIDGDLRDMLFFPKKCLGVFVSRLKIMAGMDIAERRVPQDGRFRQLINEKDVDFRVATLPTVYGEKTAIRVLDRDKVIIGLDQLGLTQSNLELVRTFASLPYGMILVTGSTGSGKTTTVYNMLSSMDSKTKNIITLEDPVEYLIRGMNQVQVSHKSGLSFSEGLGSILRNDPDIVMIGEIRDRDTANLAIQAALTGHLVISTLHTNTAVGAVARLIDLGVERFLLSTCMTGVISQRLVRRLCPHCRTEYCLKDETVRMFGMADTKELSYFRPVGCNKCGDTGYKGRIVLHEVLPMGAQIRAAIHKGASMDELCLAAELDGMIPIKHDGLTKASQGLTSLEEVMSSVLVES